MAHLTLAGLSDDGKRLLLVSDKGVEFTLDVDARLRAALRGEHARLGQLEITDGQRPPPPRHPGPDPGRRDARGGGPGRADHASTRSCRSPRPCWPSASTSPSAPSAPPYAASRRGPPAAPAPSATRSPPTCARSTSTPTPSTWDAWRREDGRWTLTGDFAAGQRSGIATFTFDAPGNYVVAENDDARWLLGEQLRPRRPPPRVPRRPRRRPASAGCRRRRPTSSRSATTRSSWSTRPRSRARLGAEQPVEAYLDDAAHPRRSPAVRDDSPRRRHRAARRDAEPDAEPETRDRAAPARPAKKTRPRLGPELGRDHVRRRQVRADVVTAERNVCTSGPRRHARRLVRRTGSTGSTARPGRARLPRAAARPTCCRGATRR